MIFLINLSPLYNYWLLSGSWCKLLVGALKGSLGGVTPLRPSNPDPFQDKNIFILHKSTTPSNQVQQYQFQITIAPPPPKCPLLRLKILKRSIALQFSFHCFWENVFEVKFVKRGMLAAQFSSLSILRIATSFVVHTTK